MDVEGSMLTNRMLRADFEKSFYSEERMNKLQVENLSKTAAIKSTKKYCAVESMGVFHVLLYTHVHPLTNDCWQRPMLHKVANA